jgi:hypothetical protein
VKILGPTPLFYCITTLRNCMNIALILKKWMTRYSINLTIKIAAQNAQG